MPGMTPQPQQQAGERQALIASELRRVNNEFLDELNSALLGSTSPSAGLRDGLLSINGRYVKVLERLIPSSASAARAIPSTRNGRDTPKHIRSPTKELQRLCWPTPSLENMTQYGLRGLLRVTNPDVENDPSAKYLHRNVTVEEDDDGDEDEEDDEFILRGHLYRLHTSTYENSNGQRRQETPLRPGPRPSFGQSSTTRGVENLQFCQPDANDYVTGYRSRRARMTTQFLPHRSR
jgi:hypothetical protein